MKKYLSILPILLLTTPSLASTHPDTQDVGTWEELKKFDDSKCKKPAQDRPSYSNFVINGEIVRIRQDSFWVETPDGDRGLRTEVCTGVYKPELDDWEYFDESTFPSEDHIATGDCYPTQVGDDLIFYGANHLRFEENCNKSSTYPVSWGVRFNKKDKKWLPISLENAPEPAGNLYCNEGLQIKEDLGDKLFVWGGVATKRKCDGKVTYTPQNGGGIYDPKSDSWTPMSNIGAPEFRFDSLHILIKERNLWVMYGGRNFFDFDRPLYSDLNIYDIKNDTWETVQLGDEFAMTGNRFNSSFYRNGNIYFFSHYAGWPWDSGARGFKYNLDTERVEWLVIGGPSSPDGYLRYAGHDGKLVFLWFSPHKNPGAAQDLYIFDLDSETWTVSEIPLQLTLWIRNYCTIWYICFGATIAEGSLFSGPAYYDKENRLYAAFQYVLDTGEWLKIDRSPVEVSSFGYFPRGGEIPVVMGNEIYLFGPNGAARFKGELRD